MSKTSQFGQLIPGASYIEECITCAMNAVASIGSPTHFSTLLAKADNTPAGGSVVPNLNGGPSKGNTVA